MTSVVSCRVVSTESYDDRQKMGPRPKWSLSVIADSSGVQPPYSRSKNKKNKPNNVHGTLSFYGNMTLFLCGSMAAATRTSALNLPQAVPKQVADFKIGALAGEKGLETAPILKSAAGLRYYMLLQMKAVRTIMSRT